MQWDIHCAEQRTGVHSRDQGESRHIESVGKQFTSESQQIYVNNTRIQSCLPQHSPKMLIG